LYGLVVWQTFCQFDFTVTGCSSGIKRLQAQSLGSIAFGFSHGAYVDLVYISQDNVILVIFWLSKCGV
jgi:hypothetical protein